jgi:hypothetical protein
VRALSDDVIVFKLVWTTLFHLSYSLLSLSVYCSSRSFYFFWWNFFFYSSMMIFLFVFFSYYVLSIFWNLFFNIAKQREWWRRYEIFQSRTEFLLMKVTHMRMRFEKFFKKSMANIILYVILDSKLYVIKHMSRHDCVIYISKLLVEGTFELIWFALEIEFNG